MIKEDVPTVKHDLVLRNGQIADFLYGSVDYTDPLVYFREHDKSLA